MVRIPGSNVWWFWRFRRWRRSYNGCVVQEILAVSAHLKVVMVFRFISGLEGSCYGRGGGGGLTACVGNGGSTNHTRSRCANSITGSSVTRAGGGGGANRCYTHLTQMAAQAVDGGYWFKARYGSARSSRKWFSKQVAVAEVVQIRSPKRHMVVQVQAVQVLYR